MVEEAIMEVVLVVMVEDLVGALLAAVVAVVLEGLAVAALVAVGPEENGRFKKYRIASQSNCNSTSNYGIGIRRVVGIIQVPKNG